MSPRSDAWTSRRQFLAAAGVAGAGLALGACGGDDDDSGSSTAGSRKADGRSLKGSGEVNVHTNGGAFERLWIPAVIKPFERDTGIKVNLVFSAAAAEYKASIKSGSPKWDMYALQGGDVAGYASEGLLAPIDYGYWRSDDLDAVGPDKPEKFGVPMGYYAISMFYKQSEFPDGGPTNWADFWDVDRFPGKRTMYPGTFASFGSLPECALLADGVTANEMYPCDLDRAYEKLSEIRGDIVKFAEAGEEPVQLVTSGRASVGVAFGTRIQPAIDDGEDLVQVWDEAIRNWDSYTVPENAENSENGMKFIAYSGRARAAAALASKTPYAPSNSRALALVPPDRRGTLITEPKNLAKSFGREYPWWVDHATEAVEAYEEWAAAA